MVSNNNNSSDNNNNNVSGLYFFSTSVGLSSQPTVASLLSLSSSRSEVTKSGLSCGLLVDWLERLDPEITTVCPDLQQKLLFALNKVR